MIKIIAVPWAVTAAIKRPVRQSNPPHINPAKKANGKLKLAEKLADNIAAVTIAAVGLIMHCSVDCVYSRKNISSKKGSAIPNVETVRIKSNIADPVEGSGLADIAVENGVATTATASPPKTPKITA